MDCHIKATQSNLSLQALIFAVEDWARHRDILKHSTPTAQLMKTVSELGELADATLHDDKPDIIDGLGDVLVTLIIYAQLQGVSLQSCLQAAYDTIKDRTGRLTASGVFRKDEPAEGATVSEPGLTRSAEYAYFRFTSGKPISLSVKNTVYNLVCTSPGCPEQYDVKNVDGEVVGYLRLRGGVFRADCPACGGETVYTAATKGDGIFEDDERIPELTAAVTAIDSWWQKVIVTNKARASNIAAR